MTALAILRRALAARVHSAPGNASGGQILVLFAIGIFVLLGAIGLGVDGSRLLEERRNSQAAADQAALTAARLACKTPGSTATEIENAGRPIAAVNGFTHGSPASTEVLFSTAAGSSPDGAAVTVTVHSFVGATFARAIGFGELKVSTTATAQGKNCGATATAGPDRAIYAGGTCPTAGKYSFENSGSTNRVFGGVHANDDVSISGSGNLFTEPAPPNDPFTHVGTMNPGAGNTYQTGYPLLVPMPAPAWPAGWAPADITGADTGDPGAGSFLKPYYDLAVAQGRVSTTKLTSLSGDGVYYNTAPDGVDIGSVSGATANVVIIATRGTIKISDSDTVFNAYTHASLPRPGMLIISDAPKPADKACEEFTVALSGSNVSWNGVIWAPYGQIEFSGSSNVTANGLLVGHSVKLNGSNLVIRYAAPPSTGATPTEIIIIQ